MAADKFDVRHFVVLRHGILIGHGLLYGDGYTEILLLGAGRSRWPGIRQPTFPDAVRQARDMCGRISLYWLEKR